ncbi:hypothetical protein [Streptomyces noursei]|uniref:hypothetical protein n=1 Tax=Streptomyces noursei TaxID=1971 RepID=UPI0011DCFE04|nr:hypothetical protein [Streptomyces noursei]
MTVIVVAGFALGLGLPVGAGVEPLEHAVAAVNTMSARNFIPARARRGYPMQCTAMSGEPPFSRDETGPRSRPRQR